MATASLSALSPAAAIRFVIQAGSSLALSGHTSTRTPALSRACAHLVFREAVSQLPKDNSRTISGSGDFAHSLNA
jgi:hypothetical protein